jgi:hypothetical protein
MGRIATTGVSTMFRLILAFGLAAGVVAILPMSYLAAGSDSETAHSYVVGYAVLLLALSLVFVGVKRYRDRVLGGAIRFLPALGVGLAISAVAGVVYVIGWEITLPITDYALVYDYAASMIVLNGSGGASAAELAKVAADMAAFKVQYMNPLVRLPMTFAEIFPVGVLVSLVSAALLRNSRFLPARPLPA